jgi:hypothetical protein
MDDFSDGEGAGVRDCLVSLVIGTWVLSIWESFADSEIVGPRGAGLLLFFLALVAFLSDCRGKTVQKKTLGYRAKVRGCLT